MGHRGVSGKRLGLRPRAASHAQSGAQSAGCLRGDETQGARGCLAGAERSEERSRWAGDSGWKGPEAGEGGRCQEPQGARHRSWDWSPLACPWLGEGLPGDPPAGQRQSPNHSSSDTPRMLTHSLGGWELLQAVSLGASAVGWLHLLRGSQKTRDCRRRAVLL